MKCWFGRLLTFTFLLLVTSSAQADPIPWTYVWTRSPSAVASDGIGTGGINLTPGRGVPMNGDSDINAVLLSTFSSAPVGTPDHFTHAAYHLTLAITDSTSHLSKSVDFSGYFDGTLTPTSSNIDNHFDSPTTQQLQLDNNLYTVSLNSYVAPGIPDSTTFGSIGAHVSVRGGTGVISSVPEPASLILGGLALPAFGMVYWRRRQTPKAKTLAG